MASEFAATKSKKYNNNMTILESMEQLIKLINSVIHLVDENITFPQAIRKKVYTPTDDDIHHICTFVMEVLPKTGKLITIPLDAVAPRFRKIVKKCNVSYFRLHDLRHYTASILH